MEKIYKGYEDFSLNGSFYLKWNVGNVGRANSECGPIHCFCIPKVNKENLQSKNGFAEISEGIIKTLYGREKNSEFWLILTVAISILLSCRFCWS